MPDHCPLSRRQQRTHKPFLGLFSLVVITVGSVVSVRNLPATAVLGSALIFFMAWAFIFFLLPSTLIAAELASTSREPGGVYIWVKQAFGTRCAFIAIWCQWMQNLIWYPTILSFMAGTLAYLIAPDLVANKHFLMGVILITFWIATGLNALGTGVSARLSNICTIAGVFIPIALIIALGAIWWCSNRPVSSLVSHMHLWPGSMHGLWVAVTGVTLSFCGMEVTTVHGQYVKLAHKAYPRALFIAALMIMLLLLLGALSMALVLSSDVSLTAGLMQAFHLFFAAYGMKYGLLMLGMMLAIGSFASVNNWMVASTQGMLLALQDIQFSKKLSSLNGRRMLVFLLLVQAVLVSGIVGIFVLMPTVNTGYWFLTVLGTQIYMVMYILMFAAGIRLRYKNIGRHRGFMIPGRNKGMWCMGILGTMGALGTAIFGFFPPAGLGRAHVLDYELVLTMGLLLNLLLPLILVTWRRRVLKTQVLLDNSLETR